MQAKIFSATPIGIRAHMVEIEVDLSYGMLQFFIVGLPDTIIKESRQRIQTALKTSGIKLPERKITVNLAPADLKKEGTFFDLPIAIGILAAAKIIQLDTTFANETVFIGELSLNGSIRPIRGVVALAFDAQQLNKKRIIVPRENAQEAALAEKIEVIGVTSLVELIAYLKNETVINPTTPPCINQPNRTYGKDFAHVKGQYQAKRALQIAAAGNHNILFIGPPGSGKTMLAQRLCSIMPPLSFNQIIETTKIYSISGKLSSENQLITQRPFRNPHHTISQAGLVGGGSSPQPGEISLTHNGILFLDELTEFKRSTLEVLRQPLESKTITISRATHAVTYPASFLLVAALNPCPCGFLGDTKKTCVCSRQAIEKYLTKLSGPLLDRIDLQINIQSLDYETLTTKTSTEQSSDQLYQGVQQALEMQRARFETDDTLNSAIPVEKIDSLCTLSEDGRTIIKQAFEKLSLSMRGYHKLLKVARTIADLEKSDVIQAVHIREALMYRSLDQTLDKLRS